MQNNIRYAFEIMILRLSLFASKIEHRIRFNNTEALLKALDGRTDGRALELRRRLISRERASRKKVELISRQLSPRSI